MITMFYAGILGLLFFIISIATIKARGREKVSLGVGEHNQIIHLVSAHSNFANYTPLFLILLYFVEQRSYPAYLIHLLAITFLIGRVLHFLTMLNKEKTFSKRKTGMQLTLWPLILLSLLNCYIYVKNII
jgi:uncharacterized membrane protein YecN with MAPEG domain